MGLLPALSAAQGSSQNAAEDGGLSLVAKPFSQQITNQTGAGCRYNSAPEFK
jgi:hypothetical protein